MATAAAERSLVSRRLLPLALMVLAFVGFLISFYLTITHFRNVIPPCYVTSGCESVITSRYSVIAGVPVSLLGTLFFGIMFYLAIALATVPSRLTVTAYWALAMAGALASLFLFLVQAFILEAYCSYCITIEIVALLMFAGSFFLPSGEPRAEGAPPRTGSAGRAHPGRAGRSGRRSPRVRS